MPDAMSVLEVLVGKGREREMPARIGIQVQIVFLRDEAGQFRLPPGDEDGVLFSHKKA